MDSKAYKQMVLDELYAPYLNCQACPLARLGRTHIVFGEGNADAQLMIIGEGPGADEDRQGRPFVGRSGQLLNHVLEAVHIRRNDVFITNIVKCRPPANRQPLPSESTVCKKLFLFNQIKIIKPTVLCSLGASALSGLLETDVKITKIRGHQLSFNNSILIPTYHPAYILRNPKELERFIDDLTLVASLLKKNQS